MTPFQTFADEDLADPAAAHGDAVVGHISQQPIQGPAGKGQPQLGGPGQGRGDDGTALLGGKVGGRPVRTSSSNPSRPRALKRLIQWRTVLPHRSIRRAISSAFRPPRAWTTIWARRTKAAPSVCDRVIRSSSVTSRNRSVMALLPSR